MQVAHPAVAKQGAQVVDVLLYCPEGQALTQSVVPYANNAGATHAVH